MNNVRMALTALSTGSRKELKISVIITMVALSMNTHKLVRETYNGPFPLPRTL